MKIEWNKKYTTIAVYATIVIVASALLIFLFREFDHFTSKIAQIIGMFTPFIAGLVMAFIANLIMKLYEKGFARLGLTKKIGNNKTRGISLILTYLSFFLVIGLFANFLIPGIASSINDIVNNAPRYIQNVVTNIDQKLHQIELDDQMITRINKYVEDLLREVTNFTASAAPIFAGMAGAFLTSIKTFIFGLIISIYMLMEKEHLIGSIKMTIYGVFSLNTANRIVTIFSRLNVLFREFIKTRGVASVFLGVLFYITFRVMGLKYALLMGIIQVVTNIIPWIGPWLGFIPCVTIIAFEAPEKIPVFILITLIIQQFEGDFLTPKLQGDAMGMSPFWILFAVLLGGELFGLVGMIIGIPIFALFYGLIKEGVVKRLDQKQLPTDVSAYSSKTNPVTVEEGNHE